MKHTDSQSETDRYRKREKSERENTETKREKTEIKREKTQKQTERERWAQNNTQTEKQHKKDTHTDTLR